MDPMKQWSFVGDNAIGLPADDAPLNFSDKPRERKFQGVLSLGLGSDEIAELCSTGSLPFRRYARL